MSVTDTSSRAVVEEIGEAFLTAYNTGDVDAIDEYVTDDFVCHHVAAGEELQGAEAYKGRIEELREVFPDFEMTEELLVVEGDRGAGHYRWTGTQDGEFQDIPATGKAVDTTSVTLLRLDGEQLAEMWVYGDPIGLMSQLGVDPR